MIYDISVGIHPRMAVWPGDPRPEIRRMSDLKRGDVATVSWIGLGTHAGTHVDAPAHFLAHGATADALPLDLLVGPCIVVETEVAPLVTAADLEALSVPPATTRLLLKTCNSALWSEQEGEEAGFRSDFVSLAPDAAAWIVDRGVRLVGVDYLSVEAYDAPRDNSVHRTLLTAGVIILEGLNLADVVPGSYTLVCLPLKVAAEGAPARAVLLAAGR